MWGNRISRENELMSQAGASGPARGDWAVLIGLSVGALAFHLLVNAFGGYGIFRDEYYYIACSKRLAAGYVDQPPLAMFLLAASRAVFGVSQFGIRVLPALAHALTVLLAGLIARNLGGRRTAVMLTCVAVSLTPLIAGHTNIFQMNAFAHLLWALAVYLVVLIVEKSRPGLWILLGIVMGLGLLNKLDFLWFGAGLAAGLLLTDLRRHLRTPWPYAAAGIALLVFSPFIIWNITHDFAHIEFIRNATAGKYSGLTRLDFLAGQVEEMNPFNMLLGVPGLFFLLFNREGRRYRVLGIIYVAALAILLANPHSKSEYLGPAYMMLFAAGGVAVERWAGRGKRGWAAPAVAALSVISSLLILPFAVPVLPVEAFIKYSAALGVKPATAERKKLSELPQFYADMFGWEALAKDVSAVYLSLPETERASAVVFAGNYGEAASLEYYSGKYALPRVLSTHNSYWFWGYPKEGFRAAIVLGGREEDHRKSCDEVTRVAVHTCRYCMPYENNMPIFVCRGLRVSPADIWKSQKSFK
jgi:4-amino-4-deoxy-L-arabinose transferase-like glycosyltransferase